MFGKARTALKEARLDSIRADGDSPDQLDCDWHYIDNTVTKAWLKFSRRPIGYFDCIMQLMDPSHPEPTAIPTMHAAMLPSAHDSLSDMTLTCELRHYNEDGSTCGDTFTFNAVEQLRYKQLGFENLPKSCMKHNMRGQKPQDAPKQYSTPTAHARLETTATAPSTTSVVNIKLAYASMGTGARTSTLENRLMILLPITLPRQTILIWKISLVVLTIQYTHGNSSYRGP